MTFFLIWWFCGLIGYALCRLICWYDGDTWKFEDVLLWGALSFLGPLFSGLIIYSSIGYYWPKIKKSKMLQKRSWL